MTDLIDRDLVMTSSTKPRIIQSLLNSWPSPTCTVSVDHVLHCLIEFHRKLFAAVDSNDDNDGQSGFKDNEGGLDQLHLC